MDKFEEDWVSRKGPATRSRLEDQFYHFAKPKMHLLSHYKSFIIRMGAPDNFSTDISELLHIANVKEVYRSTNRVSNFMFQVLRHNDRHTSLDYMHLNLRWLALNGWYTGDSARVLGLLTVEESKLLTRRARKKRAELQQPEPAVKPSLRPPCAFSYSAICAPSQMFKPLPIGDASSVFRIPTLAVLLRMYLNAQWGRDAVHLIWGAGDDFKRQVIINVHNKVRARGRTFHNPENIDQTLLDCTLIPDLTVSQYKRPPQVVWNRVAENDSDDGLRGRRPAFPLLYFTFTPPLVALSIRDLISRCGGELVLHSHYIPSQKESVLRPSPMQLAVVVGTTFKHRLGHPEEVDGFIRVVRASAPHIVAVESIEGPCHLVPEGCEMSGGSE